MNQLEPETTASNKNIALPTQNSDIKVSIVTACYQDLENLKMTANSVLSQTYPIEWIIVDSDSGLDTRKYLGNLNSSMHVINWNSEKDKGIYDGMNNGYLKSTGELVLFLNAGDLLANKHIIENVVEDYLSEKWMWSVALAVRISADGNPRSVWEYLNPDIGGLALGTRTFCHQSTFYTRIILDKYMPYDNSNLAADHLMNVKCFKSSAPRMLTFVSTFFLDGGISSKRPFSASMSDLRRIRQEEQLLFFNSYFLDVIISQFVVTGVRVGGLIWRFQRKITHKFSRGTKRITFE